MPLLFWPPSQPFKAPKPPRLEPREMVGTWESSAGAAQAAPAAAAAAAADKDPSFDWEPAVCCYSASHSHTVPRNRSLAFAVSAQAQRFLLHICGRRRAGVACQSRKSLQVRSFQPFSHPVYATHHLNFAPSQIGSNMFDSSSCDGQDDKDAASVAGKITW